MSEDKIVEGWINPLAFLDVDEPWATLGAKQPKLDAVIDFLCPPGMPTDIDSLIARYKEISTEPVRLFAAPAEPRILEKLVWPLRHAKGSYVIGNYLAVIALSGMVTEMVAILAWEIGEATLGGHLMNAEEQKALFGSTFERLGQDRRVKVLTAYGMIDEGAVGRFDTVRNIRRKYLHIWSQDHDTLSTDAKACFHAAVALVTAIIGQDIKDGKIMLNPRLIKYLEKHGVCEPVDDDSV
jgi:hypothetical protein